MPLHIIGKADMCTSLLQSGNLAVDLNHSWAEEEEDKTQVDDRSVVLKTPTFEEYCKFITKEVSHYRIEMWS
ncbi:402_t:CDS:2, partial [Entrophospora sp. SA101]